MLSVSCSYRYSSDYQEYLKNKNLLVKNESVNFKPTDDAIKTSLAPTREENQIVLNDNEFKPNSGIFYEWQLPNIQRHQSVTTSLQIKTTPQIKEMQIIKLDKKEFIFQVINFLNIEIEKNHKKKVKITDYLIKKLKITPITSQTKINLYNKLNYYRKLLVKKNAENSEANLANLKIANKWFQDKHEPDWFRFFKHVYPEMLTLLPSKNSDSLDKHIA